MNDVIKLVLSLSLSGSILALIILALKPLVRHKVSKSIQYLLWIVVIFRFLVPFSFEGSIVNEIFYKSNAINYDASSMRTITQKTNMAKINPDLHHSNNYSKVYDLSDTSVSSSQPDANEKSALGTEDSKFNFIDALKDIFYRYSMLIWILGMMFVLIYNLVGYLRFLKQVRKANRPASNEQSQTLNQLSRGHRLELFRNPYVKAPMLIGLARPCVIIPDTDFSEKQIKYILLHEINHMKRFDIAIKWLTMIAQAIHWFNPLMYFIRKEIDHACELACDEASIKNLSVREKQEYGDTLIDVAAGGKYNPVPLHATLYKENQSLKDRLTAIINHGKKSKAMVLLSAGLFIAVVAGALYLGAGVGIGAGSPPNIYISAEYEETKKAVIGTYSWNSVNADSVSPLEMKYKLDNIVNISSRQQMSISTQKIKIDRKYDFTLIGLTVYKEGRRVQFESPEPSIMNGVLYFQAPVDGGEYIYEVKLGFKDKGQVIYSFVVRVDMMNFDLDRILKLRTPYVGEAWKVSDLAQNLPVPEKSFIQRYISLETNRRPYGLTVFYGLQYDGTYVSEWPLIKSDKASYSNLQKNALVLFCMVDNLDKITFAFRNSPSGEKLDETKYDSRYTFFRTDFQDRYGNLSILGKDLKLLRGILEGKNLDINAVDEANDINKQEFTNEEVRSASALIEEYFRAVEAKDEKAILKTMTPRHNAPNVAIYGDETVTLISGQCKHDDPIRYNYVQNGRGKLDGVKLENVLVFKVKYSVHYPDGVVTGPASEGDYTGWNMILVRKDKNSPWLIDDQGY